MCNIKTSNCSFSHKHIENNGMQCCGMFLACETTLTVVNQILSDGAQLSKTFYFDFLRIMNHEQQLIDDLLYASVLQLLPI